ncbi:hypothetical protein [Streptomyces dioscori]|uniref:hypothetical protein n=1 Tax=Streptomyces dioscori TaxID=2109333 RepID=UPI001CECF903|nr:hypothetical protein [Streptomyces dioscori]
MAEVAGQAEVAGPVGAVEAVETTEVVGEEGGGGLGRLTGVRTGAGVRRGSGAAAAGGPGDAFASPSSTAGAATGPAGRPSSSDHQMPPITNENNRTAVLVRR